MDMFCRDNFDHMCIAIEKLTTSEDDHMKAGLRTNLAAVITKSCKHLRDRLFLEKKEVESNEMEAFLKYLKSNRDLIISIANYELELTRLKKNGKPCNLPPKEDLMKLHKYILLEIEEICGKYQAYTFWSSQTFIKLRNLALSRLTLLNGRRGTEVGRFLISEWQEASRDEYIDKDRPKTLSSGERMLVRKMKVAFLSGKGNKNLVSIFIPIDSKNAMTLLCDEDVGLKSGVDPSNR